jgi:hypothetical protein
LKRLPRSRIESQTSRAAKNGIACTEYKIAALENRLLNLTDGFVTPPGLPDGLF